MMSTEMIGLEGMKGGRRSGERRQRRRVKKRRSSSDESLYLMKRIGPSFGTEMLMVLEMKVTIKEGRKNRRKRRRRKGGKLSKLSSKKRRRALLNGFHDRATKLPNEPEISKTEMREASDKKGIGGL